MQREQKVETIESLNRTFTDYPHVILTGFRGLSVAQATDLRRRVRAAGGSYLVIKNRLAKRAAQGTPAEPLAEHLTGPKSIAYHKEDPVALAKALADFSKDNPQLELVAGVLDAREVLDADDVKELAKLPGLPELRAQLLALIQTPATSLVRLLSTPGTQLARVLDARWQELDGGGSDSE